MNFSLDTEHVKGLLKLFVDNCKIEFKKIEMKIHFKNQEDLNSNVDYIHMYGVCYTKIFLRLIIRGKMSIF